MNNALHTQHELAPKAILINHWKLYFENGQTRRIKNLAYTLTPVDHDAITRKELMREPGGHTALVLFHELIGMAASCPQRGLLASARGVITPGIIAADTGLTIEDVKAGLRKLEEVFWISHILCPQSLIVSGSLRKGRKGRPKQPEIVTVDAATEDSPDLHIEWEYHIVDKGNGPETEKRLPEAIERLLNPEPEGVALSINDLRLAARTVAKGVACHSKAAKEDAPEEVACHTEAVDINKVPLDEMQAPQSFAQARPIHKVKSKNKRPFYQNVPQRSKKKR